MAPRLTLYSFSDHDRSARVRWLLHELGGYQIEEARLDFARGEDRAQAFKRISPLGKVPAIDVDGMQMSESAAICMWLAERHPESGLDYPPGDPLRPAYLQACSMVVSEVDPSVLALYLRQVAMGQAPADLVTVMQAAQVVLADLDAWLGDRPYLVGERFSVADILLGYVFSTVRSLHLLGAHPRLCQYAERVLSRPAAQQAGLRWD